jgi:hypothetical protein
MPRMLLQGPVGAGGKAGNAVGDGTATTGGDACVELVVSTVGMFFSKCSSCTMFNISTARLCDLVPQLPMLKTLKAYIV